MAKSPAHKLGQIIGDALEATIEPLLKEFAKTHNLYLDRKGKRLARKGKKLTWKDLYSNTHDLDFVLERNGSEKTTGDPLAFVEIAWRRYTKHSRNKVQEIQGAIIPLRETYKNHCPFLGVVLAGEFTETSLQQLRSLGFTIVCFSYTSVLAAFSTAGVDVSSEEGSTLASIRAKVSAWEKLALAKKLEVYRNLAAAHKKELEVFMQTLADVVNRKIAFIRILPLYGKSVEQASIASAIQFLKSYDDRQGSNEISKFEIQVRFANGDKINAEFASKASAIDFLEKQHLAPVDEGSKLVKRVIDK